jgi:hypothetical protein
VESGVNRNRQKSFQKYFAHLAITITSSGKCLIFSREPISILLVRLLKHDAQRRAFAAVRIDNSLGTRSRAGISPLRSTPETSADIAFAERTSLAFSPLLSASQSSKFGPGLDPTDDILNGIGQSEKVLSDRKAPAQDRAVYLSWLIRLVEDVHMPLHAVPCSPRRIIQGSRRKFFLHQASNQRIALHSF